MAFFTGSFGTAVFEAISFLSNVWSAKNNRRAPVSNITPKTGNAQVGRDPDDMSLRGTGGSVGAATPKKKRGLAICRWRELKLL
jgi:hypothetical protein